MLFLLRIQFIFTATSLRMDGRDRLVIFLKAIIMERTFSDVNFKLRREIVLPWQVRLVHLLKIGYSFSIILYPRLASEAKIFHLRLVKIKNKTLFFQSY